MSKSNPMYHVDILPPKTTNISGPLVTCTYPNPQCSHCDSFRVPNSFCLLKHKEVKWYNKCEHYTPNT